MNVESITNTKYKVNGKNTKYPSSTPNCLIVEITSKAGSYVNSYFSPSEYALIMSLKKLYKEKRITIPELHEIIDAVEGIKTENYSEATFNATYEG